jgi:hypothetical protein
LPDDSQYTDVWLQESPEISVALDQGNRDYQMESTEEVWSLLDRLPELLQKYSTHSYVLLSLLALAGIIPVTLHYRKKKASGEGSTGFWVVAGGALLFLSISGVILKYACQITSEIRNSNLYMKT